MWKNIDNNLNAISKLWSLEERLIQIWWEESIDLYTDNILSNNELQPYNPVIYYPIIWELQFASYYSIRLGALKKPSFHIIYYSIIDYI